MGVTSGVLIDVYLKYPIFWLISAIFALLFVMSIFFSFTFRNSKPKKKEKLGGLFDGKKNY
jgi:heme/copper-type cytochrome/quinol oxidase subunit 2